MNELEKKLVELGVIDTTIECISVDDWFENATIKFMGKDNVGEVSCTFKECVEISLKHDKSYPKEKKVDGSLNYKYFIQDIKIIQDSDMYVCSIFAWPLEGEIVCKEIVICNK